MLQHAPHVPSDLGKAEDPMLMASDGQMTFSLSEKNAQGRGNVELPEAMALESSVLWLYYFRNLQLSVHWRDRTQHNSLTWINFVKLLG